MVWFATPGQAANGAGLTFGPTPTETAKPVEPVSAFNVSNVIGRPIPIVVGTGKVDGIPVIGGSKTITVVTGGTPPGGSLFNFGGNPPVDPPISTTKQVATLGYLLAYDPFGSGYKLIRVEINNKVVFDAENGIGASENFRFYGGNHTEVDPIAKGVIGEKAGAWRHFAMIYIDGFAADSEPTVKCVISNAATDSGGTHEIAWITNDVVRLGNSSFLSDDTPSAAYDIADGIIYQALTSYQVPGLTQVYLAALDVQTHLELYRVPLADSQAYVNGTVQPRAMPGSGYILVRMANGSADRPLRVYNATTGAVIAEWNEDAATDSINWLPPMQFGQKWVTVGCDLNSGGGFLAGQAVVDLAFSTISVTRDTINISDAIQCRGRTLVGSISYFGFDASGTDGIYEYRFDGDLWTHSLAYTQAGTINGIHYDPQTDYLVVSEIESSVSYIRLVNPETATVVSQFTLPKQLFTLGGGQSSQGRVFPKPGFALFQAIDGAEVWLINVAAGTASLMADVTDITGQSASYPIYDLFRFSIFNGFGDDHWTEYRLPNTIPGAVSLRWLLTKVMFLAGYTPEDLTFDGDFGSDDEDPGDGGGGDGGWGDPLPDGSIASLDFVGGSYYAGGSTRAVADLLGGGFDPTSISGSGMYVDNSNANRPNAIGALASDIATGLAVGCTIVFEIDHVSDPYGFLMCIMDAVARSLMTNYVNIGHNNVLEDQADIWFHGEVTYSGTGLHKSAFTLGRHNAGNYDYSVSVDGATAVTQTVAYAPFSPVNTITIGHDGDDTFVLDDAYIRSIKLYPAKDPADLPALTA
ncbi:hypothetical protein [Mesorhizobium sp. ES1-3]|uniref:hypothetical protein n=1 Tax=Mesorhizobium sp. ES1-3 TaxID=2876628 RepID=UPI001CCC3156|nr:hypothetical protein [Mesorhizobium sp. ES1-3]MBZ9673431.1 hypothetical protein [Mesorhizobium sp. ES1-3]